MAPKRGKCVFNVELGKKYSFLELAKDKTPSDVHCVTCNSEFSIAFAGKLDIEKYIASTKHKKALQAASTSRQVTQFFPSTTDQKLAACEGVWTYQRRTTVIYHRTAHQNCFAHVSKFTNFIAHGPNVKQSRPMFWLHLHEAS